MANFQKEPLPLRLKRGESELTYEELRLKQKRWSELFQRLRRFDEGKENLTPEQKIEIESEMNRLQKEIS